MCLKNLTDLNFQTLPLEYRFDKYVREMITTKRFTRIIIFFSAITPVRRHSPRAKEIGLLKAKSLLIDEGPGPFPQSDPTYEALFDPWRCF